MTDDPEFEDFEDNDSYRACGDDRNTGVVGIDVGGLH